MLEPLGHPVNPNILVFHSHLALFSFKRFKCRGLKDPIRLGTSIVRSSMLFETDEIDVHEGLEFVQ